MPKEDKQKVEIVSVSLPIIFLNDMDEWAAKLGSSRSEFIRASVHYYIAQFLQKKRFSNEE